MVGVVIIPPAHKLKVRTHVPYILTLSYPSVYSEDMVWEVIIPPARKFVNSLSQKPRAISFPRKRCNYQNHNRKEIVPFFLYLATKEIFLYHQITHLKVCIVLGSNLVSHGVR